MDRSRLTAAETVLEVRGLAKRYAKVRAVHDVSFSVGRGEIVGLLGRNGAGKTTTLNMVLGVLEPSAVVIFCEDGKREIIAVDGGFISVSQGRVSILSEYARMADEITLPQAEKELAEAQRVLDTGDGGDEDRKHFLRATAQLRAAEKAQ